MKIDVNWATFSLALLVAVSGWVVWWIEKIQTDKRFYTQRAAEAARNAAEAAKKEYAAERDFNHIKNNLKQMGDGISLGFDGLEERFNLVDRELLRLQAYLIAGISKKSEEEEIR